MLDRILELDDGRLVEVWKAEEPMAYAFFLSANPYIHPLSEIQANPEMKLEDERLFWFYVDCVGWFETLDHVREMYRLCRRRIVQEVTN